MRLGEAVEDFLLHLREVNRSPQTYLTYERALRRCLGELAAAGLPSESNLAELTPTHLRAFSRALLRDGLAPRSRAVLLSAVRAWLRYLTRSGHAVPSPDLVDMPRLPRKLPELDERLPATSSAPTSSGFATGPCSSPSTRRSFGSPSYVTLTATRSTVSGGWL